MDLKIMCWVGILSNKLAALVVTSEACIASAYLFYVKVSARK